MSGLRSGGRVPVSRPHRRIYPSPDPSPSLPHLALATPAGPHLPACPLQGALDLHPSPLPTEYEQQPAPVPSMEKKRTVYQMALSKMSQHGSPNPPPYSLWGCRVHSLPLPSCELSTGALEPRLLHTILVPPTLLCFVISGPCLLGWGVSSETETGPRELFIIPQGSQGSAEGRGNFPFHCLFDCLDFPTDKLDEILAAAQQTISASEGPGPGGLASLGKHRPKGFFATEVGNLV